jgi:hypothetical protein
MNNLKFVTNIVTADANHEDLHLLLVSKQIHISEISGSHRASMKRKTFSDIASCNLVEVD